MDGFGFQVFRVLGLRLGVSALRVSGQYRALGVGAIL